MAANSFPLDVDETYEVQLGKSFSRPSPASYHMLSYDFKPASVSDKMPGRLEVGRGRDVTITIPNTQNDSASTFRGPAKEATKECVLIIEPDGTMILEKLSSIINVKQTRSVNVSRSKGVAPASQASMDVAASSSPMPHPQPVAAAAPSSRPRPAERESISLPVVSSHHNLSVSTNSSDSGSESSSSDSSGDSDSSSSSSDDDDEQSSLLAQQLEMYTTGLQPNRSSQGPSVNIQDDLAVSDSDSDA